MLKTATTMAKWEGSTNDHHDVTLAQNVTLVVQQGQLLKVRRFHRASKQKIGKKAKDPSHRKTLILVHVHKIAASGTWTPT